MRKGNEGRGLGGKKTVVLLAVDILCMKNW